MKALLLELFLATLLLYSPAKSLGQTNYLDYHKEIIACELLIADHKFEEAIEGFDSLFSQFDFVFLRDCKLATQLSAYTQDSESGIRFLKIGIANGWTLKSIENDKRLGILFNDPRWKQLESEYNSLRARYLQRLNIPLRDQVHEMFRKDQKKALGALLRIGQKSQDRYAEKKFAPHSEKQLEKLNAILMEHGFPGEQFIGNSIWASTILSHHNSISKEYVTNDTLYLNLRPKLLKAIEKGELSPYEFALIEDWRTAVINNHDLTSYGFIGAIPNESTLAIIDRNRAAIGLRSIALRNTLVDLEAETGMDLYLPGGSWQKGKITVASK